MDDLCLLISVDVRLLKEIRGVLNLQGFFQVFVVLGGLPGLLFFSWDFMVPHVPGLIHTIYLFFFLGLYGSPSLSELKQLLNDESSS